MSTGVGDFGTVGMRDCGGGSAADAAAAAADDDDDDDDDDVSQVPFCIHCPHRSGPLGGTFAPNLNAYKGNSNSQFLSMKSKLRLAHAFASAALTRCCL